MWGVREARPDQNCERPIGKWAVAGSGAGSGAGDEADSGAAVAERAAGPTVYPPPTHTRCPAHQTLGDVDVHTHTHRPRLLFEEAKSQEEAKKNPKASAIFFTMKILRASKQSTRCPVTFLVQRAPPPPAL